MLKTAFQISKYTMVMQLASSKNKKLKRMSTHQDVTGVPSTKKKIENKKTSNGNVAKKEKLNNKSNVKNRVSYLARDGSIEVSNKEKIERKREKHRSNAKRKRNKKGDKMSNDRGKRNIEIKGEVSKLDESSSDESEMDDLQPAEKSHVPECGFCWDDKPNAIVATNAVSSSDDEKELAEEPKRKKKKLSAAERREQERQKEREIRQREEALASNQVPNSIDQFDRLALSSPDSSLVWLQYMAYHLQATEIDKARAVAKRAIKTINFREENERLNVWNAWLNLESRFGTPESLKDVFQEAVRVNDAQKIYTHMLTVHADAGRQPELEKIINSTIGKFKQDPQTWIDCGTALLKIGLKEKSRHIMQRALQSLPASQHVNLMVRFANLENKLGDKERSQTLFEQILTSYPKRVDVWSSYVDCLVKSDDIDIARRVLERAVVQTLPARKMKTLFKKFMKFEEEYGTPEAVAHVQRMAADYVEKQCNKESI